MLRDIGPAFLIVCYGLIMHTMYPINCIDQNVLYCTGGGRENFALLLKPFSFLLNGKANKWRQGNLHLLFFFCLLALALSGTKSPPQKKKKRKE